MSISPVGSTTNVPILENKEAEPAAPAAQVAPGQGHSEKDQFETSLSAEEMRLEFNLFTAYMRMKEGDNSAGQKVADEKIFDEAIAGLEAIKEKNKTENT